MDRVAYKPLSSEATRDERENDQEERQYSAQLAVNGGDEQDDDDDDEDEDDDGHHEDGYFHHNNRLQWILTRNCANLLGLKQLRKLLYTAAILLTLVFLALLSFGDNNSAKQTPQQLVTLPLPNDVVSQPQPARAAALYMQPSSETTIKLQYVTSHSNQKELPEIRPQYDSYMSSIVGVRESGELSTDDLHVPPSKDSLGAQIRQNSTIWWALNMRSNYVTVTDYIRANKSFNYNSSLTLTTQATVEFLYHSLELCKRWDGPISLAVYVPGNEFQVAISLIKFMRQCLPVPLSACIRDKLTWHLVYDKAHGPPPSELGYPRERLDIVNYPLFVEQDQCPKLAGPNPEDLIRQFADELRKRTGLFPSNYREQFKLTYPINVLRNTARLAANTKYVLASDIELYPSINLVPSFVNYINRHNIRREYSHIEKFVFTLPIFEVKSTKSPPKTKKELVESMQQGDAIFFHKWVCDACQAFPNRLDWLEKDEFDRVKGEQVQDDEITIFEVTRRDKEKNSWEPIFIGTNDDPLYDDRLTWDGRRDKMGQMFEMCLQNYYLLVIGNAFLVHAPGIKHIDKNDVARRYNFMRDNNIIYEATMERLKKQYAASSNIEKC